MNVVNEPMPCAHCQQGSVVRKNEQIVDCQSCFIAPQPADDQPMLETVVEAPLPPLKGLMVLVNGSYSATAPIYGGPCPQCGAFFAWQHMLVAVCPHCGAKCRTGPVSRLLVYVAIGFTAASLIAMIVCFLLDSFLFQMFFYNTIFCIVIVIAFSAITLLSERVPLVDSRQLTSDELALVAPLNNSSSSI